MAPRRTSNKRHARTRVRRTWYRRPGVLSLVVLPAVVLGIAGVALFSYFFASVPLPEDLDTGPTVVLDIRGEQIGELTEHAGREHVALADVPIHVRQAVLAAEDASFYEHRGVSLPAVLRAVARNVLSGQVREGGSTISQQYVKNVTGDRERTGLRKVKEAALAVKLEREYSKDEIFELYLNTIYFGRGAYGIEAASHAYFDKPVTDLRVVEGALLAGLIPAPSALDPADAPERALQRYRYVLSRMVEEGWLDPAAGVRMATEPPRVVERRPVASRQAPFFLALLEAQLVRAVEGQAYRGLTVHSTLDLEAQRHAEAAYGAHFAALRQELGDAPAPTGALVALDPASGGVRAMVGGSDYSRDQFNLATGGPEGSGRQPGSTFKTFALAAFVEHGRSPETVFDAPATIAFSPEDSGDPNGWRPGNYGGRGYGTMTVRAATEQSVNTVYAQLALEVGPQEIARVAQEAGITKQLLPRPSIVLGTQEVTPLELAAAYNTLAAGGMRREPHTIVRVEADGRTIFQPNPRERRVLSERAAWHVADVLQGVIERGTGTAARIDRPAAGKTGTTNDSSDAWFAGYTPDLTTVVWMGHRDTNDPMAGSPTGGGLPARLWQAFMSAALQDVVPRAFPAPPGDLDVTSTPEPTGDATAEPTELPCPDGQERRDGATPGMSPSPGCLPGEATPTPPPATEPPSPAPSPDSSPVASPAPGPAMPTEATETPPPPMPAPQPSAPPLPEPVVTPSPPETPEPDPSDPGGGTEAPAR